MRVTLFGYLCRDRNILPNGQTTETVGGKGLYMAAALAQSGVETDLITWLPEADAELALALSAYPVNLHIIPIPVGTVNTNEHRGDNTITTTRLDPFTIEPEHLNAAMRSAVESSQAVIVAPDIQEKISLATLDYLANLVGSSVTADIGRYFRKLQSDGQLIPRYPWPEQAAYLPNFSTVKVSAEDLRPGLDAGESLLSLARQIAEHGPHEVIISRGSQGAFIFSMETNEGYDAPAYPPRKLVDLTGAGDTFLGAYVARRLQSDSLFEAGRYASMAASLKLNYVGPLQQSSGQIDQALADLEQ